MDSRNREILLGKSMTYRISVRGELDLEWSDWLKAESFTVDSGVTTIIGVFKDQPALHSLLGRLRDLGIPLISVCQLHTDGIE